MAKQKNLSPVKIKLLADRVLVKVDKVEESKTAGGIIIPAVAARTEESPVIGVVMAVSPRVEKASNPEEQVLVGDKVIMSKYAGSDIRVDDVDYKVARITDIFGVLG